MTTLVKCPGCDVVRYTTIKYALRFYKNLPYWLIVNGPANVGRDGLQLNLQEIIFRIEQFELHKCFYKLIKMTWVWATTQLRNGISTF